MLDGSKGLVLSMPKGIKYVIRVCPDQEIHIYQLEKKRHDYNKALAAAVIPLTLAAYLAATRTDQKNITQSTAKTYIQNITNITNNKVHQDFSTEKSETIIRTLNEPEISDFLNEKIKLNKEPTPLEFHLTYYDAYDPTQNGKTIDSINLGRMKCGRFAREHLTVAVPREHLGSIFYIPALSDTKGKGFVLGCDTGSAISKNEMDIFTTDPKIKKRIGSSMQKIYHLGVMPQFIRYKEVDDISDFEAVIPDLELIYKNLKI